MTARHYAIIGTGAIGGYYGGLLARHGHRVHFLLRSDFDHVQAHGLRVDSVRGGFTLPPQRLLVYARPQDMPPCDVAIVCLKSTHNHLLPQLLPPLTTRGAVLMFQNGLGVEQAAADLVGPDRVLGGLAFVCCHKVGPGHVAHLDYGQVRLGELVAPSGPPGISPRLAAIAADFAAAGIDVQPVPDLLAARWHKLVWNIPYNGLSVVLDAATDRIMADPAGRDLCRALMVEVQAGATACGKTIADVFIDEMLDHTLQMTPYLPSMKLDFDAGRALELDALYAAPLRAAAAAGVALPRIAALHQMLRFLAAKRKGSSPR